MAVKTWRVDEFYGLDQSGDGALRNEGTSPDTRNMDTEDGNLTVAKGYVKHIAAKIPGAGPVRRLRIMPLMNTLVYVVVAEDDEGSMHIYAYDESDEEWHSVYKYPQAVQGRYWDFVQCNIGNYDYLLVACGEHQIVKWDGVNAEASLFGTGETLYESSVSAYADKVVTLAGAFSEEIETAMKRKGLVVKDAAYEVESIDRANRKVTLKNAPAAAPAVNDAAKVRGGVSTAKVNYLAIHFSRLFAAGDPEKPSRLYYSQIAGDGRTIEDWSADDFSVNAGGGFMEVGDSVGDPIMGLVALSTQLLIIKRYSIYRLLGDRPGNYTIERVDAEVERLTHTAVTMHGDVAFYLTPAGLCYFNNVTAQVMPDARNLQKFMKGCYVSQSKACEAKDRLYFSCYRGDDAAGREYDDHIIVYDVGRRTYTLRDGFDIADLMALDGVVYMVNSERFIFRFDEGEDYDGRPIDAYWKTQCTDWRARAIDKKVDEIFLRGVCEKEPAAMLLTTRFGGREKIFRALVKDDPEEMMEIQPHCDWARTFQFCFRNEAGSRFSLHGGMEVYVQAKERAK